MRLSYTAIVGSTFLLVTSTSVSAKNNITPPIFDMVATVSCEAELRSLGAKFKVLNKITGSEQCGSPRPLILKKLKGGLGLSNDVTLRCKMALALAHWVSEVVVPSAELHLKTKPSKINISTSYKCRRRNGDANAKMSEHAYANAADLMGIDFINGNSMKIQERTESSDALRAFQAAIRGGACAYFTTVIGPTTNEAHADHLHLDLAERRNGFRLCE
jgi:hypothetical protein